MLSFKIILKPFFASNVVRESEEDKQPLLIIGRTRISPSIFFFYPYVIYLPKCRKKTFLLIIFVIEKNLNMCNPPLKTKCFQEFRNF